MTDETLPETVTNPEYVNTPIAGPEVLVYLDRLGPYSVVHMEHGEPARDGSPQFIPHRLTLLPGLNLVDEGLLDTLKVNNPRVAARIDVGEIQEVGDPETFAKHRKPPEREAMVVRTASRQALEAVLEYETHDKVVAAIEDELVELRRKDSEEADKRRDQRRARRRNRGGRR